MTDKFWDALVTTLGRADLNTDARFATQAARQSNRELLTETLDAEFRKQPTTHWMAVLAGVLPAAPVYDMEQALENPFLRTADMVRNVPHPERPDMRVLSNPIKIDGKRLDQKVCSPVGADNEEYLAKAAATP